MKLLARLIAVVMMPTLSLTACGQSRFAEVKTRVEKDIITALGEKGLKLGSPIFIRAFKEEKILELFVENKTTKKFELFRSYLIAAASGDLGPKLAEGDGQVPEGFYFVSRKNMNPQSAYHLSFNIGYPNNYDLAYERTGSAIMIHGSNASVGCLAMTDEKIEEIYTIADAALNGGQSFFRVHIFPFRMTEERMTQAADSNWIEFWKNLKTGHDLFEENDVPPNVSVVDKIYAFE
jgi:murein L,D-transpeptidase YafK